MKIPIKIDRKLDFKSEKFVLNASTEKPSYVQFPETRGVYIFHLGPLNEKWLQKDKVLYIGEANNQKLKGRISINYRGKIRPLVESGKINISDVYVTYYKIEDSKPNSLSKLIERAFLYAYEDQFKELPRCNRE